MTEHAASLAAATERAAVACAATLEHLRAANVTPEALAEYVPAGKRFRLFPKPATMRHLRDVWRLGVLLLGEQPIDQPGGDAARPALWAGGHTTRAAERGRPGYQSVSREERKEIAAAALRGGYPLGKSVNFDATPIPLSVEALAQQPELPVGYSDGEFRVRWRAGAPLAGAQTLASYLAERAELVITREPA